MINCSHCNYYFVSKQIIWLKIVLRKLKFYIEKFFFKFLNNFIIKSTKRIENFFAQRIDLKNSIICKKFMIYKIEEGDMAFFGQCKGTGNT
jgi:hypothetical protein